MMTQENLLARYKVLHELGRGATGAVYAARERTTGAVVALRRLDPALLSKSGASLVGAVLKHARSARRLSHPNIARIHDAGEAGGTVYIAMEMLEGESVRRILDQGPLPIARAIQIARDIACGLAYAHLEGAVHGAIKPSNIIVSSAGVVKITDFGVSSEHLRGAPLDYRSDIFSLGALFYEMLTHRPPLEGKPALPSELNPHVPRALDAIVLSMLAAQPGARMPGIPILLRELQRLEEGLGLASGASPGSGEQAASVAPAEPEPEPMLRTPAPPAEPQDRSRITDREVFDTHKAMIMMEREARQQQRSSRSRPAIFAVVALALGVLGFGLAGFVQSPGFVGLGGFTKLAGLHDSPRRSEPRIVAERPQEAPPTPPRTLPVAAPPPVAQAKQPAPAPEAPQASPPRVLQEAPPVAPEASRPTAPAPVVEPERAPERAEPAAKAPQQQPGSRAQLILAVSPGGEIYINGKHHGTTPPIKTLDLEPGMHRVEVRNGSRKPYLTYMTVQAGDVRRIRHDFNAKPSRPPGDLGRQRG